jgi:hypothetical protein
MSAEILRATLSRRHLLAGTGAVVVGAVAVGAPASAASDVDAVLEWYDTTAATIGVITGPQQVVNSRTWAIGWIAGWRAAAEVTGSRAASAALASAVHDALVTLAPTHAASLDAALAATLARLGDSRAVRSGVQAGQHAAAAVLAERAGDGLDPASVNRPFQTPAPAPGIWQPTPPAFATAVQAGQGDGRTFLLGDVHRYDPGPPPPLNSAVYARDLAESHAIGVLDSTVRTAAQTDVARFWAQTSLNGFTGALRAALAPRYTGDIVRRIRLVALFHAITIDAQITTYAAKYRHLRWRPVTAIRTGPLDPDPAWTPLIATPAHPEYPSGHTTYAGAAETTLTALAGSPRGTIALSSPAASGVILSYTAWHELTRDNIDARVWSGIHLRHTDEVGARIGRQVALADLSRWNGRPL